MGYVGKVHPTGHLPGFQVLGHPKCVVVEHLLEVGHEPTRIDGVAVESSPELVVDAASRHLFESQERHLERLGISRSTVESKQEPDRERRGKLVVLPQSAPFGIEARGVRQIRGT